MIAALLTLVLFCPQQAHLDAAVRSAARGEPLRVSSALAVEAAEASLDAPLRRARLLLIVAGAGRLPLARLRSIRGTRPPAWAGALETLPLPAARVAVVLLAQRLPASALEALLADDRRPPRERDWLARLTALTTPTPAPLLRALAGRDDRAWDPALRLLLRREPELGRVALGLVKRRPSPGLVRALAQVGQRDRVAAARRVILLLDHDDPELVAAAVAAGAGLRLSDVADRLPELTRAPTPTAVRRAALAAVPPLLRRDRQTLGLLIEQLDDPRVSTVAHASLKAKSGAHLALDARAWRSWLSQQTFESESPEARSERLERDWRLVLRLRAPPREPLPPAARSDPRHPAERTPDPDLESGARVVAPPTPSKTLAGPPPKTASPSRASRVAGWLLLVLALAGLLLRAALRGPAPPRQPSPRLPAPTSDLGSTPTRRLDRLRQALVRQRTRDPMSGASASSAEAEVLVRYRRALERLREAEGTPSPGVAHLSFGAGAATLEQTLPVTQLFRSGAEDPAPREPDDERTTPLAEVFDDERTTPLAEVFAQPPSDERTTPLAEVFAQPPSDERTTPLAEVFDDERTTPLAEVFDDERTTPLAEVFPDPPPGAP